MREEVKITVFTPTYNRGYIIHNLYHSLKKQTVKNFEWIVIDDGSIDNTQQLFEEWMKADNNFQIKYTKVLNGGKHRAINKGLDIAKGELFIIVDSDDYLVDNAIEMIIKWEDTIKGDKSNFAGISGNKGYDINTILGTTFEGDYIDATNLERNQYNILGDKAEVYYTEIMRKFKFPEFQGENFITESVVWNRIAAAGYKIRWFNEVIMICEYLDDGLTMQGNELFKKNPKGYALYLNQENVFYRRNWRERVAQYIVYYNDMKARLTIKEICKNLEINLFYFIFLITLWKIKHLRG